MKTDHNPVCSLLTPRGTNTRATANPSGMLWTARDMEMKRPRSPDDSWPSLVIVMVIVIVAGGLD